MIRRLSALREAFGVDAPEVYILAPEAGRAVPAGDTRRGTAWIFRTEAAAARFGAWIAARHGVSTFPTPVPFRDLAAALADKDLTWVLDPEPKPGHGAAVLFKAPLPQ